MTHQVREFRETQLSECQGVGKMTQLGKALAHEPGDLRSVQKKPHQKARCNAHL